MRHYAYLIIGGGMAADAAVKGIRSIDENWEICVVGSEPVPPYKRPPLSKQLWKGKPVDSIWLDTTDFGITLELGKTVTAIDLTDNHVVDHEGVEYGFDKILIAAGGTPKRLPFDAEGIIYYRTFDDYNSLRRLCDTGEHFAVIGGGFIGSEIAAALAMNGRRVTMLFSENAIGSLVYPADLASYVTDYYVHRGVHVRPGETIADIQGGPGAYKIRTNSGETIEADGVIAGIGISPNTKLAEDAGLEVDNGIVVDTHLRAGSENVFAAGDVANFHLHGLNKRTRVEHEDNAVTMGKHAGEAMAGHMKPYTHIPYFYSDLFDLGYEAVGELRSNHETFCDWQEQFAKGVVYYLSDSRVVGVLLWNVWGKVPAARELVAAPGPFTPQNLKGRIS